MQSLIFVHGVDTNYKMTDDEIKNEKPKGDVYHNELPEITMYEESSKDSMTEHSAKSWHVKAKTEKDLQKIFDCIRTDLEPSIIGFTCGAFDCLHPGHMMMLKEAKTVCNYLIVGLQIDPTADRPEKNKPIQTIEEREEMLIGCRYVDEVIRYNTEEELYNLIKMMREANHLHVRIIGEDWKYKKFTGCDLPIPVYFNSRKHDHSTSNFRKKVYLVEKNKDESCTKTSKKV